MVSHDNRLHIDGVFARRRGKCSEHAGGVMKPSLSHNPNVLVDGDGNKDGASDRRVAINYTCGGDGWDGVT
jgi:hypothetical protein